MKKRLRKMLVSSFVSFLLIYPGAAFMSANAEIPSIRIQNTTYRDTGYVVQTSDNTADIFLHSGQNYISGIPGYMSLNINYDSDDKRDELLELNCVFNDQMLEELTIGQMRGELDYDLNHNLFKTTTLRKIIFKGEYQKFVVPFPAIHDTTELKTIVFPEKCDLIEIEEKGIFDVGLEEIEFPHYTRLYYRAFSNAPLLENITFRNGCDIRSLAFDNCPSIKNLTFNGECNVGALTFAGNENIENIDISDTNKTTFHWSAFNECINLMTINSECLFDSETHDFTDKYKQFIFDNFSAAENVGFINEYLRMQVEKIIDENITPDMSDIQKVRALHDWICNKVDYDYDDANAAKNHRDTSVLFNDRTVCEGYSRFYDILLREAGIESCYVDSSDHAWNIIKIGGHYFHSDTTWDDIDSSYKWFLRSDSEMKKEGGSHGKWTLREPSPLHAYDSTEAPLCDCQIGDVNKDGELNVSDLVGMSGFLHGKSSPDKDDAVLYDMDFDGYTDVLDMIMIRRKVISEGKTAL